MDAPETVSEAVAFLEAHGYRDQLRLPRDGQAVVDYTFRFEGPSDPADEAIVLGVSLADGNRRGVIVSAFGPGAEPEDAALLVSLITPAAP